MVEFLKAMLKSKLVLLLLVNFVVRAAVFSFYPPVVYPDSRDYLEAANGIASFEWTEANGKRVPVYPLVLLAAGFDLRMVMVLQHFCGIAVSLLLFSIVRRVTMNDTLALVGGLSYTLNIGQLFFEANVLSETVATLLLTLTMYLLSTALEKGRVSAAAQFVLALAACLAVLTRPLLLSVPFVVLLSAAMAAKKEGAVSRVLFVHASVIAALLGGVVALNGYQRNYAGITTLLGFNLINHAGSFLESSTVADSTFTRIYLAEREKRKAEAGTQSMTIYRATDELRKAEPMSFEALSKKLTAVSLDAIRHNPGAYAGGVITSLVKFWKPALRYNRISESAFGRFLIAVENRILAVLYACFLLGAFYCGIVNRRDVRFNLLFASIALIVLCTWVGSSLIESGENHRYKISCEPVIVASAIILCHRFYGSVTTPKVT